MVEITEKDIKYSALTVYRDTLKDGLFSERYDDEEEIQKMKDALSLVEKMLKKMGFTNKFISA